MDQNRSNKLVEPKSRRKNYADKKTKSDITSFSSGINLTEPSVDSIFVVGKGIGCGKPKSRESGYHLHECHSEASVNLFQSTKDFKDVIYCEGVQPVPSNSSFISAKSDLNELFQKQILELEDKLFKQSLVISSLRKKLGPTELVQVNSVATETDSSLGVDDHILKLKVLEKKILNRDKKIKDLTEKLEESLKVNDGQNIENATLTNRVSLLNRQLQSMFEFLREQKWNSVDPSELAAFKNKATELEVFVQNLEEEKSSNLKKIKKLTSELEKRENELNVRTRELIEYKNRSTLEMCKLINEIDSLQKEAKNQSQLLDLKIAEAQTAMEDEIVNITLKLEEQYQKDVKAAMEKFQGDFEQLASLPRTTIEQLLKFCEPKKIDLISYQKEWDSRQAMLELKIASMQEEHNREIVQLKENYESKILFLKTQVEAMSSQLKERKDIIDIFENELMMYKSNTSINLLKASTLGDDISALKELYTAEIFSQKQVHKLQLNVFEEKVKSLTEEILYHAKNEEIQMEELGRARKMATIFREKYENLVHEWGEKVEKDLKGCSVEVEANHEVDTMMEELRGLLDSLKQSENIQEEKIKMLEVKKNDERLSFLQDIECFKTKIQDLAKFQMVQSKLDETVQNLVKTIGMSYSKTVEALLMSHAAEVSLKHMEMCASEKRHVEEMDGLKNKHEKELEELRNKIETLEKEKKTTQDELKTLRNNDRSQEIEALKKKTEDITLSCIKSEGMIAIKDETEEVLIKRVRELEDLLRKKEENCRRELEDLTAKYMKAEIISASKDDLVKELEEKLNKSRSLLEKTDKEMDRLTEICSLMKTSENTMKEEGDFERSGEFDDKFQQSKKIGESLKRKLVKTFDRLEKSEKACGKRKEEKSAKQKLELLETEKNEILAREKSAVEEKENALQMNELLERRIQQLNGRIDELTMELADNENREREEVVSFSLQEVWFFYEEEQESCLTDVPTDVMQVLDANKNLRKENEALKSELRNYENEWKAGFSAKVTSEFENIEKELSDVVKERDQLMTLLESLGNERNRLKEELNRLLEENHHLRERIDVPAWHSDDSGLASEMNEDIGKLTDYIKTLSKKLEVMKTNNELLLQESQERLRQNQNLVSELEEAWCQRYEIEDQLTKVRKENALLNLHRRQLEKTNQRISKLVAEGKPSVVSWIKIHETVENIVDEVLALKTSFSDSGSVSGASTGVEVPRTNSEITLMTETLHAQLKNKTVLCDELIYEKDTLEKELKNLESLLRRDNRLVKQHMSSEGGRRSSLADRQRFPEVRPEESCENSGSSSLITLKRLKKHLEDQVELEEAQFRENLELEIRELKREIQSVEERPSGIVDECLKSIEAKYEEEVAELANEFEREVERLKKEFESVDGDEESCGKEIEELKKYFENKWRDLEKRYTEMYNIQKQKRQNSDLESELQQIREQVQEILSEEEDKEEEKKTKLENVLKSVMFRREEETRTLKEKYKEAMNMLESKHDSEVEKLQSVVLQLKDNIMTALKSKETGEEVEEKNAIEENLIEKIRAEYETKLEEEKKKLSDLLEEEKRKHEKDLLGMEEFWTEKLSECETKCAIMKATSGRSGKKKNEGESEEGFHRPPETKNIKMSQASSEVIPSQEEKQIVKYGEEDFDSGNYVSDTREGGEENPEESLCVSCLSTRSLFKRMEVKTDDDKLDVMQQRDSLEEMISSMRSIITKLVTFIGQYKPDLNNTTIDIDDTMYKSIHLDLDRTVSDASFISNGGTVVANLTAIFQEIKDNSLLNSSDQVRSELEKCLKQLKRDATSLLALSCPDSGPNLGELIKKLEKEKNELETKVLKVEEEQKEMRKEMSTTKERLNQWERNLEVVSEGYGEEVVAPKQVISLADMKEKLKTFLTENCGHSPQDINLLEEICKEGDRLQKEWLKEKCDLQQQMDVADKQVHSLKKFLEEQAVEREQEREAFDKEVNQLREALKAKERDSSHHTRMNREMEALMNQIKDLTGRLTETEKNKEAVEGEFQNAVKKIWSLREVIQELELQLAEVSERECNLKKKVEKLENVIEEESKVQRNLKEELEACRAETDLKYSEHIKSLEEELVRLRHVADQVHPDSLAQLKSSLRHIEGVLMKKTKELEQLYVSSANVSCSSPSEDLSIRDHLDATRCSTPDEMTSPDQPLNGLLPVEEIDRVLEKLARHTRAEEVAMKYIQDLRMQLRNHRKAYEEVQTERDVLLEKVDGYLKENSSLKVRLEEQRCNAGLLQKQLNANLESQIGRLEVELEKLNEMCNEKDKQLRDMKVILENTTKSLKVRETEALNKSKEENALILTLKTDLANALNENEKLEETLEKTREKLRETLKMPALIDSMIDEKNAEIDRLEKEVARLSSDKSTSGVTSRSCGSVDSHKRRIRFSEPDSFSENISSISVQCLSDVRNCSDSYADFRNSSFKSRRQPGCSTKLESISSIAPLQLSPRGVESSFHWKTSSPIFQTQSEGSSPKPTSPATSPPKPSSPTKQDLEQMEELSKLQKEIEAKGREIAELHLEIDKLKRQLVEANQEVATAKSQAKEIQNELVGKEEEIRKFKNNEYSLLETMESLKKNHREEVEELENKLKFEHGKVETVYEEIKALEVKKIEIEEAFLSLREDYNEKLNGEKKTAEALLHRIRSLEGRNGELELKMATLGKELEKTIEESEKTVQSLSKEISDLKNESFCQKTDAETQWEGEGCVCQGNLTLEMPKTEAAPLKENLHELKTQFDKMAAVIGERDFNKKDAFVYAMTVRQLLTVVLGRVEELTKEVEAHMKRVMECSVDDLAVKVQRELVLSAKLDNQLLSSIEANGFVSKEATPDSLEVTETQNEMRGGGGGDGCHLGPKPLGNAALAKVAGLYRDVTNKMGELVREREDLKVKVSEQQKIIRLLEESLRKEKERILEEKDRCAEDAKIMELLRVNLEKRLHDVKSKERELKREKQARMGLEKEIETYKKQGAAGWESKKVKELSAQLESQKEKLVSMGQLLEEEKKKVQELKLSLEEERIERMSEKNARRLVESDLSIFVEEKENLKMELLNAREMLHSRNVEIGLLKRKINLQEIDIKALSVSRSYQNPSDTSSFVSNAGTLPDMEFESPTSLLMKMKKLNSCVQRHVKESSDVGDALLHLSQETDPMRDLVRRLEENSEGKMADDTLVADLELERKLWALEKGKLVMDVESLKRENEVLKHDLVDTSKSNELLKLENCKLKKGVLSPKKEGVTNLVESGFLIDRVAHLTKKYMRTESYRKALAWQKHYLLITLQEYQRSEDEVWKKMGRRRKEGKKKSQKPHGRFRVVALAVLSIFRMRFIVKKWQKNIHNHMYSLLEAQTCKLKLAPLASVLNIYNEPVNPLSYQTQNIFRRSSSQVLRTPPSRDPGPESFSGDAKNVPERLEPFEYRRVENVAILKGLP